MAVIKKAPVRYSVVNSFPGYEQKKDITNTRPGVLVRGSKNVLINDYEKVITRKGFTLKGVAGTANIAIRSSYDDFVNVAGIKIPVREWPSGDPNLRDIIEVWYQGAWRRITPDVNTAPVGIHEYNFAEVWAQDTLQSKLIWVNGNNGSNAISSWNGAIAEILSVTANTITNVGPTWAALGFDAVGSIVINGTVYAYTGGSTTNTLTGVTPDPTLQPVVAGDFAFDLVKTQPGIYQGATLTGFNYDVCSSIYNQVYYGDYNNRTVYVSNAFNKLDRKLVVSAQAFQNDLTVNPNSAYTGLTESTFVVTIDSVTPPVNEQTFIGGGSGNGEFVTSGYSGTGENIYKLLVIADKGVSINTIVGVFNVGEIIVGTTSGATAQIVIDGITTQELKPISGEFVVGETITGQSSGATANVALYQNRTWLQFFKNNIQITSAPFNTAAFNFSVQINVDATILTPSITLIDGLTFTVVNPVIVDTSDYYQLKIQTGSPDTFSWQKDGGAITTLVAITGAYQTLSNGIQIQFINTTGHALGDTWTIRAFPAVTDFWRNFYFNVDLRRPGEGMTLLLDSPPIGFRPQEDSMYMNSRAGSWFITDFTLAADLLSESLDVAKLKSEPQSQILHHNLLSQIKNSLVFVSKDKTYDTLGRLKLIQTPQSLPISDRVRDDFQTLDFTNGSIKFFENKSYITAPNDGIVMVFDHILNLWQPPQTFPIARLAIIDDKVCGHSYQTNETYTLFDGASDNEQPIESVALFSYQNYGTRANTKSFNEQYIEGYIKANTIIDTMIRYEIDGCGTATFDEINGSDTQIVCIGGEDRSLGKKTLGVYSLASLNSVVDPDGPFPKFRVIKTMTRYNFYEVQFGFSSYGIDYKWALLAFGSGSSLADYRNNAIKQ